MKKNKVTSINKKKNEDEKPIAILSGPSGFEPYSLKKEDVWGEFDHRKGVRVSKGMIVARTDEKCPHFGDVVPYKSVTVVCKPEQQGSVEYWLEYVHGANCVSDVKEIMGGKKLAIRSDYQCW